MIWSLSATEEIQSLVLDLLHVSTVDSACKRSLQKKLRAFWVENSTTTMHCNALLIKIKRLCYHLSPLFYLFSKIKRKNNKLISNYQRSLKYLFLRESPPCMTIDYPNKTQACPLRASIMSP